MLELTNIGLPSVKFATLWCKIAWNHEQNCYSALRQSYDVTIELSVEGTGTRSSNTLDLKNPYFRYTGQAAQPPPGVNHTSPSETYWGQLDAQGARQGECVDFTVSYLRYY